MKKFFVAATVFTASAAIVFAGSAAASTAATSTISVDKAAASLLPAKYKTAGINVASDIPYAPMEFYDAKNQPVGFDVDLANAIGAKLGTKISFQEQTFDSIIPSLQAAKHDVAMSSLSDTLDRQKVLSFVDYFNGGASILVAKGNPNKIKTINDLCGKPVAAEAATWEVDLLKTTSQACVKAGKKAIQTLALPGDTDAQNAVRSGKTVAYLADSQIAAYTVKVAGNGNYFQLVIDPANPYGYESGLIGVGVLKSNTGLLKAVQAAVQSLMNDGNYDALLKKWNLTSFKIAKATINGTKS